MATVGELIIANSNAGPGATIGQHLLSQASAGVVEDKLVTGVKVVVKQTAIKVTVRPDSHNVTIS